MSREFEVIHTGKIVAGMLAVINGADSVRTVGAAMGFSGPSTAHKWVARLRSKHLIRDLADEAGKPRNGNTLAPAFRVVAGVSPVSGRWMVERDG